MKRKILTVFLLSFALYGCTTQEESATNQIETVEVTTTDSESAEQTPNPTPAETYGTDYDSTWGDLNEANGGETVWGTLTAEQQELVNFPYLDKANVYYVPEGDAYHSVDWCYTLERSETVLSCTYSEAVSDNLSPCSKCVEGE